jgi:hypothetical protein
LVSKNTSHAAFLLPPENTHLKDREYNLIGKEE